MDDTHFMEMALALAEKGRGYTSPNPMVGAVIVRNGKVVGKGYHKAAGENHAEVNAINHAGPMANGSTLYVTLEPCNHTGRTVPCTQKILDAKVNHVVVAMKDPNPDVKGGGIEYLKQRGITVSLGLCENQAKRLNEAFIKYVSTKRPFVILKCASTLDGRIATRSGDARWITGETSRRFVHQLRHQVDGIMIGVDTVKKDNPRLTTRLTGRKGLNSIRFILDTHFSIPEDAKVLWPDADSDTIIVTGKTTVDTPLAKKKDRLIKKGIKIMESPLKGTRIDLDLLMDHLGATGVTSLLIEGGSQVFGSALSAGIVDKIFFFYGPKLLGGDDGVPVCAGEGAASLSRAIAVKNIRVRRFDDDIMIEGYIHPNHYQTER